MSEQTIQDALYSTPVTILDKYTCLSLGATTINDLIKTKQLANLKVSKNFGKKPDVLIINKNKEVIIYVEFKLPTEFDTEKKIQKAIDQEIDVARELGSKIYVVSDGATFLWLNPKTGNYIIDENGKAIKREIKPKVEAKRLADFIDLVKYMIEPLFRSRKRGRMGINGKNEYTALKPAHIKSYNDSIKIPVREDGTFDLEKQREIAHKYATIESIKRDLYNQILDLTSTVVT